MNRFFLVFLLGVLLAGPAAFGQEQPEADPALYAVGALGASNLYTTYFLLGTLADGYATAAYTAEFARELAQDIIGLNESSIDVLKDMLDQATVAADDRVLVEDMITAHDLLIRQTWGLLAYIDDPADTADWFNYRKQAWELIRQLLNIE